MHFAIAPALLALCTLGAQDETKKQDTTPEDRAETVWEYLVLKYDADEDGRVSQKEYTRGEEHWKRLDKNADGFLEGSEFVSEGRRGGGRRGAGGPGRRGPGGEGGAPRPEAPKVGEVAPDFELVVLPPKKKDEVKKDDKAKTEATPKVELVKLSSFKNKKPVALIFGSYT